MGIVAGDLEVRYSINTSPGDSTPQLDPHDSLGGYASSNEFPSGQVHNLFDRITGAQNVAMDVDYRLVFVVNSNPTKTWRAVKVWLASEVAEGASAAVALDLLRVVDSFNRSDNASTLGSADTGEAWTAHVGTWGRNGNRAYRPTSGGTNDIATVPAVADGAVEFTLGPNPEDDMGLVWRYADTSNYWKLVRVSAFGTWNIWKRVAGSDTFVDNIGLAGTSAGTVVRVEFDNDALVVKIDGAEEYSETKSEPALRANTRAGLICGAAVTNAVSWEDFSAVGPRVVALDSATAMSERIANESTAPSAETFSAPTSKGSGLSVGNIPAGKCIGVWIRRTAADSLTKLNDGVTIRAEGNTTDAP